MTLGELREITSEMPDDAYLVIVGSSDGDTHVIEAVVPHKYVNDTLYIRANVVSGPGEKQ